MFSLKSLNSFLADWPSQLRQHNFKQHYQWQRGLHRLSLFWVLSLRGFCCAVWLVEVWRDSGKLRAGKNTGNFKFPYTVKSKHLEDAHVSKSFIYRYSVEHWYINLWCAEMLHHRYMQYGFWFLVSALIKTCHLVSYTERSRVWRNMVKSVFSYNTERNERGVSYEPVKSSFYPCAEIWLCVSATAI